MRIQHNIMAMNAYRNYSTNNSALSKNLEKLSSGYKINRAGDDAAGLAISEKMRAQITGLKTAQDNAKSGINLVQTAEGSMTEVHDMLNRMVELADQSANGTYDNDTDRANLQKEVTQLKSEINRIADSSNFNGIKLLDGSLKQTSAPIMSAADAVTTDGTTPAAATKASATIQLNGTTATGGLVITGGTSTITNLGALTAGGSKLSDLFTVKINGVDKDWTTDGATTIASGATIELTAKTPGALTSGVMTALNGISGAASLGVVAGTNEGDGTAATSSAYSLDFDFSKIAGGQTFKIGDTTFELSTDGTADAGNTKIDLSGIDLTAAGTANTEGQWKAAVAIRNAVNTALSSDFNVDAAIAAAPTGNSFSLNFTSKTAGDAGNLGAVRVSENAGGAISGSYTAGKAAGSGTAGTFATASYDVNLANLSEGDAIQIGSTKINVVADADEDLANGKIGLTNAKDGTKLAAAFESNGYTSGKVAFSAGKLTVTGTTVGQTGTALAAGNGKVTVTDTNPQTSGGLTLQIGDTSDSFNQLTVSIQDMHADTLGIGDIDISTQTGASDSVDLIKSAINTVSSVRGTLGATQNRLEHTMNNLSVMTENTQDAESTIRDTDVAEEMMAYTKNNILVQSAQAMLAQANQVPQGVLQLLQ